MESNRSNSNSGTMWFRHREQRIKLLWQRFNRRFPSETACLEELWSRIKPTRCPYCLGRDFVRISRRVLRCRVCNKRSWFTAGTVFQGIRKARPWLVAIWFMEHGLALSSSRLQKLAGIAQSSAFTILKKIASVVQMCMDEAVPVFASALFNKVIHKRSRRTPADEHPAEEVPVGETSSERLPDGDQAKLKSCGRIDSLESSGFGLGGLERKVFGNLSSEPAGFDRLCERLAVPAGALSAALLMLELSGAVKRLPGDKYVRSEYSKAESTPSLPGDTGALDGFVRFIRLSFRGISRKYLQKYLAAYWCITAKARWSRGALLRACLQSQPISYRQILEYVSPALVKVMT